MSSSKKKKVQKNITNLLDSIIEKRAKLEAKIIDDTVEQFLKSKGYKPKRTPTYVKGLQERLKKQGKKLHVVAAHTLCEDGIGLYVAPCIIDYNTEIEQFDKAVLTELERRRENAGSKKEDGRGIN